MSQAINRTRLILDLRTTPLTLDVSACLEAGDVACAILPQAAKADLTPVVQALQEAGVAALIADDADLAREMSADGVHLSTSEDIVNTYRAARGQMAGDHIVGAEIGSDRHVAMVLAEAGVDYVAFQLPAGRDNVLWWSEIFEVPSVAMTPASRDDAKDLAEAGVEFISIAPDPGLVREMENAVASIVFAEV